MREPLSDPAEMSQSGTLSLTASEVLSPGGDLNSVDEPEEKSGQVFAPRLGSVVVVESDPDQQWRLARDLTRSGARVVGTSSGDGALALVREWAVDLVLVADELPGMDGYEVCRKIAECRPEVSLIMMADCTTESVLNAARGAGAETCLDKPVALVELAEHLVRAKRARGLAS